MGCGKEAKLGQSEVPVTVCHCPWGDVNQCPLTPDREPAADQCKQTADIQLGEPVSLIGVLTGVRGRVTHRSRNESRTAAFLKARPSGVTVHEAGALERTVHLRAAHQFGKRLIQSVIIITSSWSDGQGC